MPITAFPNGVSSWGVPLLPGAGSVGPRTGDVYWVHSSGSTGNGGRDPSVPVSTLASAITLATAANGDVIYVMEGHAETVSTGIAVDKSGVTIIGLGNGRNRPTFTGSVADDTLDITAANVTIQGLRFAAATTVTGGAINVAAADCRILDCEFLQSTNDLEEITVPDAGDRVEIAGCTFLVTGNGPDSAIRIESASNDGVWIHHNTFNGGSTTNVFDDGAIRSTVAHTNCRIHDNEFLYGTAHAVDPSVSTSCYRNKYSAGCRPTADSPLTIWAADGSTTSGDGTPEDPMDITSAVDRATAAGDVVNLLPGSYTITLALAMDVAGMVLQAAPGYGPRAVTLNTVPDINHIDLTGDGCVIRGIRFTTTGTFAGQKEMLDLATIGSLIEDCTFDFADTANSEGINLAASKPDCIVRRCHFILPNAGESCILVNSAQTRIEECIFDLTAGDGLPIEGQSASTNGLLVRDCILTADTTVTPMATLNATPGKVAFVRNLCLHAGTVGHYGVDTDNDYGLVSNFSGSVTGTEVAANPSS